MPRNTGSNRSTTTVNTSAAKPARARKPATPTVEPAPEASAFAVPQTPDELHAWIGAQLGIQLSRLPLIDDHAAPFDYIVHTFFEGRFRREGAMWIDHDSTTRPPLDCVIWANRGGGKTFLGALATLLDMVFKPRIQVRILAGSLEQSGHMYEHLRALFDRPRLIELIDGPVTTRRITLVNGSRAQILSASERSVRGTRVHKVRCDEVDLFEPAIWRAAQLTTRSFDHDGPWGARVLGAVEALSTMQNPFGLMWELVTGQPSRIHPTPALAPLCSHPGPARRTLFRWGVVDALEHCPESRSCHSCGLHEECAGRAKTRAPGVAGHMSIDDALSQKARVDRQTWKCEMLCTRPTRGDAVYPEFDPDLHVLDDDDPRLKARAPVEYIAGMDFGWRSETVVLLASTDHKGTLLIEREHAARQLTIHDHIARIRSWIAEGATDVHDPSLGPTSGLAWIGIDPAGTSTNDQTGKSNAAILRSHNLRVLIHRLKVRPGLQLVRARLAPALVPDSFPIMVNGRHIAPTPRLFVHARCTRLIECLTRYRYPTSDPTAEPSKTDGFDHACDALRYLVVALDHSQPVSASDY